MIVYRDPRDVVVPFFLRLEEDEHRKGYESAVKDFIKRIQERVMLNLFPLYSCLFQLLLFVLCAGHREEKGNGSRKGS